jgi:hypothetical protein
VVSPPSAPLRTPRKRSVIPALSLLLRFRVCVYRLARRGLGRDSARLGSGVPFRGCHTRVAC